jgi:hypothetical protein
LLINVDDQRSLSLSEMRSSSAYAEIHRHSPNVTPLPRLRYRRPRPLWLQF